MADIPASTATSTSFGSLFDGNSGTAIANSGESIGSLVAAIVAALGSFGIQIFVFVVLRIQLSRIYRPKTYLVAERERVPIPPRGLFGWIAPIFNTPNLAFVQKCGLDAFYFLRFLQMCLKIFLPMAVVVMPILLPLNRYSGIIAHGLDRLSISNVGPHHSDRLWAHLVLAIITIIWTCFIIYAELRSYIRVRQAYLTSPQHRIRASATTVLVTGIPLKWCTHEALEGLYDVFPGGLKNIWINRDFENLRVKVNERDSYARDLESAETVLIKKCREAHQKALENEHKKSRAEKKQDMVDEDKEAERRAQGEGTSAGAVEHNNPGLDEAMHELEEDERRREEQEHAKQRLPNPKAFVGDGIGMIKHGFGAAGKGVGEIGRGFGQLSSKIVGNVDETLQRVESTADKRLQRANNGGGFVVDDEYYQIGLPNNDDVSTPPTDAPIEPRNRSYNENAQQQQAGAHILHPQQGDSYSAAKPKSTSDDARYSPTSAMTDTTAHDSKTVRPSYDSKVAEYSLHTKDSKKKPDGSISKILKKMHLWKAHDTSIALPSPQPHASDIDPFDGLSRDLSPQSQQKSEKTFREKLFSLLADDQPPVQYDQAYDTACDADQDGEPRWREFIEEKDRETFHLPILPFNWCPRLPFFGEKVDKIYWLRRELARLNLEIETDQANFHDERMFKPMGSAFIQFHNQVAAHMAVQSVSHHLPASMAPRVLEISPDDVLWGNLDIGWWSSCLRAAVVIIIIAGMIILFAIPVAFTGLLANVASLSEQVKWLAWLTRLPKSVISIIQGVLPPLLLQLLLMLVPVVIRMLVGFTGVPTRNAREMGLQKAYFIFLWIQVFLIVTISGGLTQVFSSLASNPTEVLNTLATNLPKAANYFFSYLTIQALSSSAGALLQVGTLVVWFLLAPILDSTARQKYTRQTSLQRIAWGSFFPPFTNFAVIGLIYSVISPLILVFMLIIFTLFWIVYRYNILYVYQFTRDTGGLMFPTAVNQLFVGLYVEELCFIGYFFIKEDANGKNTTIPQAIIMIVVLVVTVIYQFLLNQALNPLYEFLPITLEDEAVMRDEAFERDNASRFAPLMTQDDSTVHGQPHEMDKDGYEMQTRRRGSAESLPKETRTYLSPGDGQNTRHSWAQRRSSGTSQQGASVMHLVRGQRKRPSTHINPHKANQDPEAQHTVADVLFGGFADELEDLSPADRDLLTKYAFQHVALRARRPIVWIPSDQLGVSVDEIKRAERMSTAFVHSEDKSGELVRKTFIAMSNKGTALDGKGRVVFRQSPPDFESVDLITL